MQKINWFPGHMKKATQDILSKLKYVDLIVEVIDARCINSSSNNELITLIQNKPIVKIALKNDLSILNEQYESSLIITNTKHNNRNKIIDVFYNILSEKIDKYHKKGLVNPKFVIMVVGLPNVGKSSLINLLKNKNHLVSKNLPGVTKNLNLVNINKNFDLIDTPGILFKNIVDDNVGYKLALINCIKKDVLILEHVIKFGFDYYFKNHYQQLKTFYNIDDFQNYDEFILLISNRYKYYSKSNSIDYYRLENRLYNDFINCKICKVNLDV